MLPYAYFCIFYYYVSAFPLNTLKAVDISGTQSSKLTKHNEMVSLLVDHHRYLSLPVLYFTGLHSFTHKDLQHFLLRSNIVFHNVNKQPTNAYYHSEYRSIMVCLHHIKHLDHILYYWNSEDYYSYQNCRLQMYSLLLSVLKQFTCTISSICKHTAYLVISSLLKYLSRVYVVLMKHDYTEDQQMRSFHNKISGCISEITRVITRKYGIHRCKELFIKGPIPVKNLFLLLVMHHSFEFFKLQSPVLRNITYLMYCFNIIMKSITAKYILHAILANNDITAIDLFLLVPLLDFNRQLHYFNSHIRRAANRNMHLLNYIFSKYYHMTFCQFINELIKHRYDEMRTYNVKHRHMSIAANMLKRLWKSNLLSHDSFTPFYSFQYIIINNLPLELCSTLGLRLILGKRAEKYVIVRSAYNKVRKCIVQIKQINMDKLHANLFQLGATNNTVCGSNNENSQIDIALSPTFEFEAPDYTTVRVKLLQQKPSKVLFLYVQPIPVKFDQYVFQELINFTSDIVTFKCIKEQIEIKIGIFLRNYGDVKQVKIYPSYISNNYYCLVDCDNIDITYTIVNQAESNALDSFFNGNVICTYKSE